MPRDEAEMLGHAATAHDIGKIAIRRTHHERWDGAGYPVGMRGNEIPLSGRICALCDVFDALVSERSSKAAWTLDAALAAIRAESGTHFDPGLVDALCTVAQRSFADVYGVERVLGPEDDELPAVAAVSTVG